MMRDPEPQSGAPGPDDVIEIAGVNHTQETDRTIDANGTTEKNDGASTTDSEQFADEEMGPPGEFQVPREPNRPERSFREFKGRHIEMMAFGISRRSTIHNNRLCDRKRTPISVWGSTVRGGPRIIVGCLFIYGLGSLFRFSDFLLYLIKTNNARSQWGK
jgi:hypothetical protein